MKQWWEHLQVKEQRLLMVMAVAVAFFLFYHLVWHPINDGLVKEKNKLERQQALLAFVEKNTQRYRASQGNGGQKASNGSLSSIVNSVARSHQISISRVQPQGEDIQVWVEQIAFNQLLQWLDDLTSKHGLQVKNIDISEGGASGTVSVRRLQLGKG